MIDGADVTGLVLAGGLGSRMGGIDKGLQLHRGLPLAQHALRRLAPQVGALMVSANRHLDAYRAMGAPVWSDAVPGHAGPLAGILTGLQHCETPWLAVVPCDSPRFPRDLVARLARALDGTDAEIATAATRADDGGLRAQPVFCLMRRELLDGLARFVAQGGRKLDLWSGRQRRVLVAFDDAQAFANANTPGELAELERSAPHDD